MCATRNRTKSTSVVLLEPSADAVARGVETRIVGSLFPTPALKPVSVEGSKNAKVERPRAPRSSRTWVPPPEGPHGVRTRIQEGYGWPWEVQPVFRTSAESVSVK